MLVALVGPADAFGEPSALCDAAGTTATPTAGFAEATTGATTGRTTAGATLAEPIGTMASMGDTDVGTMAGCTCGGATDTTFAADADAADEAWPREVTTKMPPTAKMVASRRPATATKMGKPPPTPGIVGSGIMTAVPVLVPGGGTACTGGCGPIAP